MSRALAVVLCALAACALGACSDDPRSGYTAVGVQDVSLGPIAVPIWANDTFNHGLEVELTDALVKEIQSTTPWKVASDGARSRLTGRIVAVELRPLSTANVSGLVEDMAVGLTVDWEWKRSASGKPIVAKRGFRSVSEFVASQGVGERLEVGQRQAIQELARDVVAAMRSQW